MTVKATLTVTGCRRRRRNCVPQLTLEETSTSIPVLNGSPCNGDFNCDANVDATDVTKFLEDFRQKSVQQSLPCLCGRGVVYVLITPLIT